MNRDYRDLYGWGCTEKVEKGFDVEWTVGRAERETVGGFRDRYELIRRC